MMKSRKCIRVTMYLAIAAFCLSCSNKSNDIDDRGFDKAPPKQRLELKSKLGYQSYTNYIVTANVYKDNELHKDCIVIKNDYCGKILGYRYCFTWPGTKPNPQSLEDIILPASMIKTAQKFQYSEICNDELFNTPSLNNHIRLMQQFNLDLFASIVLTNNALINNAEVGERANYYTSASCYEKEKSAFIKDSDYMQAGLQRYRYYVQPRDATSERGRFVIYEIEPNLSTYYALSGYDCNPIKGHKLKPTSRMYKGYSVDDVVKLMASRRTYCKSMCKSYDEEGKANGWATEPDSSVTPISLDDVTAEPPKIFVNADNMTGDSYRSPLEAGQSELESNAPVANNAPQPSLEDDQEEFINDSDNTDDDKSTAQRYGVKYIREITYKGKSTPSWIILKDPKGRYCAIITSSKYPILESEHYCIPFSGDDKDLKDSFAGNSVAEIDYPDHKKCKKVKTISDNDYCNKFYKAFEDMAKREQFLSVTGICKNDPNIDSEFSDHICEYLNLEDNLD